LNLIPLTSFKHFRLQKEKYFMTAEEDKKNTVRCGLILWHVIMEVLKLDTKIITDKLDTKLKALTLQQFGNKLPNLITNMEDYRRKVKAEKGTVYNKDMYVTMLFVKISCYKQ